MFYLVTGTPGAGKTLYTVSTLVQQLLKTELKDKAGKVIERRLIVDGIPDLVIPHEVMAPRTEVAVLAGKGAAEPEQVGQGLWNWWQWCRPGDVIVIDEVQRHWRPRGMGTKPPMEIQMLETHRHLGVDFIVISQNPMLIDQNVRRLVNQHLHIRRLFGGSRAVVYQWDGCSADVHRVSTCQSKSYFGYPKSAYKLYKSSELHTKVKTTYPVWLALPVLAVVGAVFAGPQAYDVMTRSMTGKGLSDRVAVAPAVPASSAFPVASAASVPASGVVLASAAAPEPVAPVYAGCMTVAKDCRCYDENAKPVKVDPGVCLSEVGHGAPVLTASSVEALEAPVVRDGSIDAAVLADLRELRERKANPPQVLTALRLF